MTNSHTPPDAQYAALAQRVVGIEGQLAGISTQLGALANSVNERSRTQWPTIFSAMGVVLIFVGMLGGMAYLPVTQAAARAERDILDLRTQSVSVAAFQDFKQTYTNAHNILVDDLSRSVPRAEHERVWAAQLNTDSDQQRQIDELKQQFGSVYGLRDIINDLKTNQEEIRKRLEKEK